MSKENQLSPEIASLIEANIKHYRQDIEQSSEAAVWIVNQLVTAFSSELHVNPIQYIQEVLDNEGIDVKFIAIPKGSELDRYGILTTTDGVQMMSDTQKYGVGMPHDMNGEYPYYLHTIAERKSEYFEMLALLKISAQDNFQRLSQTGVLILLSGSDESRIAHSPNN